ncbi:extracellular solute-binding protein [Ruminococcus flavefaciens]|uniref:extracellular solute-binding protein n=1 Tax=Ruminococcus flavefaciens TaxID=1265 RepID=UPI0004635709|nr:extracellular solute-binding protein [Ruminococcus flavefaciens]
MNNKFMRAAAFAAAACLSMSSCAEKTKTASKLFAADTISANSDNMNAAELLEGSYKLTEYKTITEFQGIRNLVYQKDGGFIGECTIPDSYNSKIFYMNSDFSEVKEIELTIPDDVKKADDYYTEYSITHSGYLAAMYTMYDNGGRELPDDYDEDFDYDEFYEKQKTTYGICFYNTDGSMKSFLNMGELEELRDTDEEYFYINSFKQVSDSSVLLALSNGIEVVYESDGKFEKFPDFKEDIEEATVYYLLGNDDTVYMSYSYYENGDYNKNMRYIVPVDVENRSYGDPLVTIDYNDTSTYDQFLNGFGDYCLLRSTDADLYGVKADGSSEKLLNWADADASSMDVVSAGNDEYYCWEYGGGMNCKIYKLVRRPAGEADNTQMITLGVLYGGVGPMVNSFNRSQSKYRIKTVDYSEKYRKQNGNSSKEYESREEYLKVQNEMLNLMQMDIISGNAPDLILCYDHNSIKSLGSKGLFTDLYSFMANDPDINRDNIVPNLLKAMESKDGHLYSIVPSFSIETLAVKSKFVDHENWTIQEMIDLYDKVQAEQRYNNSTKERMLRTLLNGQSDLVDIEKGKCRFDSPDFIEMLKFCNRFVEVEDVPDEDEGDEEIDKYFDERAKWIAQDKALVSECSGYNSYTKYDTFGGDEYTLVGFPSSDGKGGKLVVSGELAVCESSSKKEGAWEFIKTFFDYENENNFYAYGYPALKSDFEKNLDETTKYYDWDKYGNKIEITSLDPKMDKTLYPLTQDERNELERYILSCDTLMYSMNYDVENICFEEADAFFHGEKTAEEAAEMIQNRTSILVSERN